MKTYKTAKGWRIFIYITAPLLATLSLYVISIPFTTQSSSIISDVLLITVSIAMITLCVIGSLEISKAKITIHENATITVKSIFNTRSLRFNEIKGYSINDKYICIVPKNNLLKQLKIHTYFKNIEEIQHWIYITFPNLDKEKTLNETDSILKNTAFGTDKSERKRKLKKAKTISIILNILSICIGLCLFFIPEYGKQLTIITIAFFASCIASIIYFKGLIKIDQENNSAYPTLFWAFFCTCCVLTLKAIFGFNILEYSKIWTPVIIIPTLLTALVLGVTKELSFKTFIDYFKTFIVFIIFMGTTYGALILTNFYFDESSIITYTSKIIDKRISKGKTTSYYLKLKSWTNNKKPIESIVSKEFYNKTDSGNRVTIQQKEGKFNIPYYFIIE